MSTKMTGISIALIVGVAVGIGAQRFWLGSDGQSAAPTTKTETAVEHAAKHLDPTYVCPMHSNIQSNEPSSCPICGMDLVEVEPTETDTTAGKPVVEISPEVINNLGVRTLTVTRDTVARDIHTLGSILTVTTTPGRAIPPTVPGRIEWITDKQTSDIVKRGELLFCIYSPERVKAQKDYVAAWKAKDDEAIATLWETLASLNVSKEAIAKLENGGDIEETLEIYSPNDAAILANSKQVGDMVDARTAVVSLGGHYEFQTSADIFERQWPWVRFGQRATMTVPTFPGEIFEGRVTQITEKINFRTRTLPIRATFSTLSPLIKKGMLTDIHIYTRAKENALNIPASALIRTGDSARVIKALGDGRFQPVEVVAGFESGDRIEILSGLEEGDEVVVSAQFLIDSESSLLASFQRMSKP